MLQTGSPSTILWDSGSAAEAAQWEPAEVCGRESLDIRGHWREAFIRRLAGKQEVVKMVDYRKWDHIEVSTFFGI